MTSSWLDTDWQKSTPDGSSHAPEGERLKHCLQDLNDVSAADCVISFTEQPDSVEGKRGGRHVEFGYALFQCKRLIVIGFRENLFHYHPSVEFFATEESCFAAMEAEWKQY